MTKHMRQALLTSAELNAGSPTGEHTGSDVVQEATRLHSDDQTEVWKGDCLDAAHVNAALGARMVDALIFDAPYSSKTHDGHEAGRLSVENVTAFANKHSNSPTAESRYARNLSAKNKDGRRSIDYGCFSAEDIAGFCALWVPRCSGWIVSITDHVLAPIWSEAFESAGLYAFTPIPLVETGSRVRLSGDGPSNWTCWLVVARPKSREFASWGTLPGAYVQAAERGFNSKGGSERIMGAKPLTSMCGIVRDYSRPGALIADPFCGGGTTLVAAKMLGRRAIGMDCDPKHAQISTRQVAKTKQQALMPWAENA